MDPQRLRELLEAVQGGTLSPDDALVRLANFPGDEIGYAHIDNQRALRTGHPEVVFGEGKTTDQIIGILTRLQAAGHTGLVTRVSSDKAQAVVAALPQTTWYETARILHIPAPTSTPTDVRGRIAVICAGTSDLPVAEEAAIIAEAMGNPVDRYCDVGVAGIHRLLGNAEALRSASVLIVVAGMEGALASVVAGIVQAPVVAVPTSVGYGASFGGLAALLGMLNSCAEGVAVVNIDNGFGAAMLASRINRDRGS